jgi:hypothetical protein
VGIYLIASEGGAPRRITAGTVNSVRPSWSRSGSWIYFGSNRSGVWEIWKTTTRGAAPVQVTRHGGREAFEDPQGEFVYYTKAPPLKGIWRVPAGGGEETSVTDDGSQGRWAVGGRGIYYLKRPDEVDFLGYSRRRPRPLPTPGLRFGDGVGSLLAAGLDDRWILVTALVRSESHLTLVQNFR